MQVAASKNWASLRSDHSPWFGDSVLQVWSSHESPRSWLGHGQALGVVGERVPAGWVP